MDMDVVLCLTLLITSSHHPHLSSALDVNIPIDKQLEKVALKMPPYIVLLRPRLPYKDHLE